MAGRQIRDPNAPDRIVEAAGRVVATRGVHGATIRAIAAEAGVSTGYLTHYFEDKHALMVRLLDHTNAGSARRVQAASAQGDAITRLRATVDAMLPLDPTRRREWEVWVAMWGIASPADELGKGFRAGWAGLRQIFAELLRQAGAEGGLREGVDIEYEAARLVTMLAGIGLMAGVESRRRVREAAARMVDEQVSGLRDVVRAA
ncbi:MAG TPA: TetR/AcrR family transcriptional regulator [Solirubrobacteraceae bacterium]|jgi:AcrR family transcriptional regulator